MKLKHKVKKLKAGPKIRRTNIIIFKTRQAII